MAQGKKALWAQLRDTHGRDLPSTVPFSTLLAAHPALRSKGAGELAGELGISAAEAEAAIDGYVRDAVPAALVPKGASVAGSSVDARIMRAGRPAPAAWVSGHGLRSRVDVGRRAEAAGLNDEWRGVLPLGFFYRMPNRAVMGVDAKGNPELASVPAPTPYDAQCATVLRSDVPQDPNDPTLPHPDYLRAFCFAMRIGMQIPSSWQWGGLTSGDLSPAAAAVVEDVGTWPAPQAGELFPLDEARAAFAAFRWYGALSGDTEGPPTWGWDDGDRVTRQRYVFWYLKDDDGNWNKCVQVQGFSEAQNAWILPRKWGQSIQVWAWRPTDSQFVGEWRTFFSWDRWSNENKGNVAAVAVWVAAAALTIATLGAGAAALAGAAAFSAAMYALQRLYNAVAAGDPSKAVAAAVELGGAVNKMSDGDFVAAMAKGNPGLASFASSVAAPFAKIYEAAGGAASTIQAVWAQANALRSQIPNVNAGTWAAALNVVGAGDAARGAGVWLQMARLPSSAEVAGQLWDNAPAWAKDVVALGIALSAAEQAQAFKGGGVLQLQAPASVYRLGGGVIQIQRAPVAQVKARWSSVPPPAMPPATPVLVAVQGSGGSSAAPVLLLGAVVALGLLFGRK